MPQIKEENGNTNVFADEPPMYVGEGFAADQAERAEKLNGRVAMIGFIAAVGAYAVTGQLIPGFWHEQLIAGLSLPSIRKVVSPTWCHAKQGQTTY